MICRKATVALSDANIISSHCQYPSSRAQNRGFCAFLASGTPIFGRFEHKIEVLCAFALRNPHFRAFRAQNRGFCAFFGFGTPVFGLFEHKIEVFVRFWPWKPPFSGISSTKSRFLCSMTWSFEYWEPFLPFHGVVPPQNCPLVVDHDRQPTANQPSTCRQPAANQPPAVNQPPTSRQPANQPPNNNYPPD